MPPISLTDAELDVVLAAASPLQPQDRDAFLRQVADNLSATTEPIGPGTIYRAVLLAQRQHFHPPDLARSNDVSKYR